MSELSAKYTPSDIEEKWYSHWEKSGYFHNEPDEREPFSIVIPPPNVTGVLHMGHMLNNTIQDALTRKARLEGKNAIWIPGTDHASIATEAKVVRMLRERGIKKSDLTREEFMAYAWEWKEKYGGIILQQLRKLGSSCDWERTAFTMDEGYSKDVIHTFVDLYRKGKLYRDYRMVNWDCEAKTVLSNEEVIHGEEQAQLFYVKYMVEGSDTEGVTIATQRPETIMADTAVAVHPNDPRYAHLKGKKVIVPLVNRAIPIIFDEYVDIEFGTGALKVTPAHDPNDYELGKKHGLEVIDLLNDDGTLNEKCGIASLIGVDRFDARRHMKKLLSDAGNLVKIEDYKTNIGRSERTNTVVEPKMSLQWYVNMKAIAEPALQAVETDYIDFYPKSFKNTYRYWMDNIRDWCISRQLWWGHRIPAYYYGGETFVAETAEEALALAQAKYPSVTAADLKQDEDVLDTWASSWLWPISTLNGFKNSKEFDYYYPTSVLVTGWDIIFLWVARMAMAGFEWKQERPFKAVYFTGMVRDKQRRKMSKSLGNSPDALQLIEDFGADGVRFGMLASSPAGGDLLFDEKLCEQGRNFCNKLWNALRLVKGWEVEQGHHSEVENLAAAWFEGKMSSVLIEIEENFKQFRLSEALMGLYNFIWDDYCSWYLEMIKPEYGKPIDRVTLEKTEVIFRKLMAMLHPFMPFITEEIWQQLDGKNTEGADLCVAKYPKANEFDADLIKKVEAAKDIISKIREIRNNKGLKQREPLVVKYQASETAKNLLDTEGVRSLIKKLGVLESLQTTDSDVLNAVSFVSGTDKFYVVLNQEINVEEEREKLAKELTYQQGFLKSVSAKLSNERFVANAKPEIVASEQQKQADALVRIKILEESLAGMDIPIPEDEFIVSPIIEPAKLSMGILIEKVRVKNFRSLKDVEVSLTPLTLLVGSNNAGKTSFLKALNLALGIDRRNINLDDLFRGTNGEHLKDESGNDLKVITIDVKIIPVDGNFAIVEEFAENWREVFTDGSIQTIGNQETVMFRREYSFLGNSEDVHVNKFIIRGDWENPLINTETDVFAASLEQLPLFFIDAQRDIIDDLRNRTSYFGRLATEIQYSQGQLTDIEARLKILNDDAVTNSPVMSHLKNKLTELNTALQNNKDNVEITPFPKKVRDLHKTMKVHFKDGDSDVFELDYHGMGTRSWASLLAFKAFVSWQNSDKNPKPKDPYFPLLALEEPEAHLHPNAQRQLYGQLKSIGGQKIISTHSPYIVGLADLEEIRYFCKSSDEAKVESIETSTFTPNEKRKAKREILHSKGELLFSRLVVLCEGETEEQLLPALAASYFDKEPFELGVNFIGCGGSNYKMFINIFKSLNIKWIIFSDFDNSSVQTHVRGALSANKCDFDNSLSNNDMVLLNHTLEKYMIVEGYRTELISACTEFINNYFLSNLTTKNNFLKQINTSDANGIIDKEHDGLLKFMEWDKMKAKVSPYYSDELLKIQDKSRRFPPKIKQLFEAIKTKISL